MSTSQLEPPPGSADSHHGATRIFQLISERSDNVDIPADIDPADLVSLLRTEMRQYWRNGASLPVEHFQKQMRESGASAEHWLTLIGTEIQLRRESGEFPDVDEYLRRFPALAALIPAIHSAAICEDDNARTHFESGSRQESIIDGSYFGHTLRQKVGQPDLEIDDLDLRIPGYEIQSVLGRGGMGVVYKARQVGLNRIVALKMILSGCHADQEDRARFVQEAEAVAALRHANIVQVYEIGEHNGKPFFSMEYVAGGTLGEQIKGQPQAPAYAADMAEKLALAVQSAHEQSIIHRDLKPANILIADCGLRIAECADTQELPPDPAAMRTPKSATPKITDFGLAKRLDSDMQLTTTGLVAGTPQYMAPEQVSASRQDQVGPSSDIWSLGVILYEMLTGRPPFLGSSPAEIMHQVLRQEPVAIRQLQPNVPRDLETICLRCLQKEPHKRYPSAKALATDLSRFRSGEPILARPVGIFEQMWRWRRRNPTIAALIGLIALTLIGSAMLASSFALSARQEARRAEHHAHEALLLGERNRLSADELRDEKRTVLEAHQKLSETHKELTRTHEQVQAARKQEERLKKEAEVREKLRARELYDAQMTLAQRSWEIGQVPRTRRLLAAYEPHHHDQEDLRGFEWYYLDRISNAEGLRFSIPEGCRSVAVSPDGSRIAWAFQNVCEVWRLNSPPQRIFVLGSNAADRHRAIVERVACDPTGKYVATAAHDRTVKIWEAETGKLRHTLDTGNEPAVGLRFSAHGGLLAATTGNERRAGQAGEIHVWDPADGQLQYTSKGHQGIAYDVAWSPDSTCYATAGHDQCVKIWDARDGKHLRTLSLSPGVAARSVAFAPKGSLLAAGTSRGEVLIWSRDDWKEQRILRGHLNWVYAVAFWADGRTLASGGSDMLLKVWDGSNGQEIRTFRGHSGVIVDAAWHPRQPLILSASMDQSIRGWNALDDPEQFPIRSLNGTLAGFHLLPDDKHIAVAGRKAFVGVWDVTRAVTVRSTSTPDASFGPIWSSSLSPDGSALAYVRCLEADDSKGGVFRWSFANQEPRNLNLRDLHPGVRSVAHTPGGESLVTGHRDGTVQIHDLKGAERPRRWQAHRSPINQVLIANGMLLTVAGKTPRLWCVETQAEVTRFSGHAEAIRGAAISTDGRLLATASDDQTARVWDLATGKTLFRLEGHISRVTCVAFNPTADRLVTGSDDFTLKLWDLKTGHETMTLRGHTMGVLQAAFGSAGRCILSSAMDDTVRVWNAGGVSDRELLRAAAAACRLTSVSIDGKLAQDSVAHLQFELTNVSGKEWPVPPPRKTTVPYRTLIRVLAESIPQIDEAQRRKPIGNYDLLPTTAVAADYKLVARIPLNGKGLENGRYRLRIEHGWLGDEFVPISEKWIELEVK